MSDDVARARVALHQVQNWQNCQQGKPWKLVKVADLVRPLIAPSKAGEEIIIGQL